MQMKMNKNLKKYTGKKIMPLALATVLYNATLKYHLRPFRGGGAEGAWVKPFSFLKFYCSFLNKLKFWLTDFDSRYLAE